MTGSAEPFSEIEGPFSALIKALKRTMAGEYSRELSRKVFAGQCRLVEKGYRQGGVPGFGLRRLLIGAQGEPKGLLKPGERKSLHCDRVILVPGPPEEVALVRRIYTRYLDDGVSERGIVKELSVGGLLMERGKRMPCRESFTRNARWSGVPASAHPVALPRACAH